MERRAAADVAPHPHPGKGDAVERAVRELRAGEGGRVAARAPRRGPPPILERTWRAAEREGATAVALMTRPPAVTTVAPPAPALSPALKSVTGPNVHAPCAAPATGPEKDRASPLRGASG